MLDACLHTVKDEATPPLWELDLAEILNRRSKQGDSPLAKRYWVAVIAVTIRPVAELDGS